MKRKSIADIDNYLQQIEQVLQVIDGSQEANQIAIYIARIRSILLRG